MDEIQITQSKYNRNHRYLVVGITVICLITILLLALVSWRPSLEQNTEQNPVVAESTASSLTSSSTSSTDAASCIKTYTEEAYPGFGFEYDACNWNLYEKELTKTNSNSYSHDIILTHISNNATLTLTRGIHYPVGFTGDAEFSRSNYYFQVKGDLHRVRRNDVYLPGMFQDSDYSYYTIYIKGSEGYNKSVEWVLESPVMVGVVPEDATFAYRDGASLVGINDTKYTVRELELGDVDVDPNIYISASVSSEDEDLLKQADAIIASLTTKLTPR